MSPLILYNGGLLLVDGKLAIDTSCCCGGSGACCLPERCVLNAYAVYGECAGLRTDVPGYTIVGGGCNENATGETVVYQKILPVNDPLCTAGFGDEIFQTEFFAFFEAIMAGAGDVPVEGETGVLPANIVQASCQENLSQSACERQLGTYYPNKVCADNPCVQGGACCVTDSYGEVVCLDADHEFTHIPIGYDWQGGGYIWNEDVNCNTCYSHLCSAAPGILYFVNDCSECLDAYGEQSPFCYPYNGGPCGTFHPGQTCAEGPCVDPCFENIDQYGALYSSWLYPTCDEGKAFADTIFTCPDSEVFCDTPGYLCVQCDSCDFDPGRDLWSFGRWLLCIPPDLNNPLP